MMNYGLVEKERNKEREKSWKEDGARRQDWVPYPEWAKGQCVESTINHSSIPVLISFFLPSGIGAPASSAFSVAVAIDSSGSKNAKSTDQTLV